MIKPNWPYVRLRIRRIFKKPIDQPIKNEAWRFGGGRSNGVYTHQEVMELMCSVLGCGEKAFATWSGCADDNIMRPLCAEHDVQINAIALVWWGDPRAELKISEYVRSIEDDIGRRIAEWAYERR